MNEAVQLAAHAGARVTATASARNLSFVAGLGAHDVLDYSGTFDVHVRDVDVVIDPVGGTTTARSWPVMRSGGTLVAIAEEPDPGRGGRGDVRGVYFVVRPDVASCANWPPWSTRSSCVPPSRRYSNWPPRRRPSRLSAPPGRRAR